jgi:hypothetical protein
LGTPDLDDTWVNAGHTKENIWQDQTIRSAKGAFLKGLLAGLKILQGILPNLDSCVIVMDNVSYLTVKTEKLPTSRNKKNILDWLKSKIFMENKQLLKVETLSIVLKYRSIHDNNVVDEMATAQNKTVQYVLYLHGFELHGFVDTRLRQCIASNTIDSASY